MQAGQASMHFFTVGFCAQVLCLMTILPCARAPVRVCARARACVRALKQNQITGHLGRLCALCNDNYVMSTEGCTPCEYSIGKASQAIAACIVIWVVVWYVTVWRVWLKLFEDQETWIAIKFVQILNGVINVLKFLLNKVTQRADRERTIRRQLSRIFRFHYFVGYAKLMIGYYQVTASFLTNFGVDWPDMIETVLVYMNFFSLDVFNLPGIACLFKDFSYLEKHQIFTTAPLFIIFMFTIPALLVKTLSNPKVQARLRRNLAPEKGVAEATISGMPVLESLGHRRLLICK